VASKPEIGVSISATDLIQRLGLERHPEGGWYRETWRDLPADGGRGTGTAIYYLLQAGEVSAWHRVDAVEIWHWYAGAPLLLCAATPDGLVVEQRLGNALDLGERPQAIVPEHHWQSARSLGAWTLVGCTVSPAFQFSGFELAPPDRTPGRGG
jgi:predicted cupin superfamily sugar epimerase